MTEPGVRPRRELPDDPAGLEPMGDAFEEALETGLRQLGLLGSPAASDPARRSYEMHARVLREWNAAVNLTAIRDPGEVARKHVCDSLSAAPALAARLANGASLLDVGSGGGYPGLPLAAALPLGRVGLLDPVGKKARFLAVAAAAVTGALAPTDAFPDAPTRHPSIEAIARRAEDLVDQGDAWDVVTVRALGSLAEVMELGLPLVREGGVVVAWKRADGSGGLGDELRDAGAIIRVTGGGRPEVVAVEAPSLPGHRLVIVAKDRPTPPGYPRLPRVRRRGRG